MFQLWRIGASVVLASGVFAPGLPVPPSEIAGVIDRFKEIYSIPGKLDELKEQYVQMQAVLAEQQRQLEEARQTAQQYAMRQQELMEQNEAYRKQNELLLQRIDKLTRDKSEQRRLFRTIVLSVTVVAGMVLLYLLSVRVWRHWSWFKHRNGGGGGP
ncbi:hypothetical protein [Paenibacillus spongiae]|uniref:Uncharacterized protein n=1 Tax=Paenibacillus spongiae TaxID=2909671 RepID=A0ABY5SCM1_9BACL|nr:hypothetical protein [Paenibacillus spongiae]UVI31409.1 hypothetical protein L1F29_06185 [Paenibacillus spongiae]